MWELNEPSVKILWSYKIQKLFLLTFMIDMFSLEKVFVT
jgi:hypothetical protein